MKKIILSILSLHFFLHPTAEACKAFAIHHNQQSFVGKSFDFDIAPGALVVNKRNLAKTAMTLSPDGNPVMWRSQYGSVTFNQAGQEFPFGGMNETGFVVEILWLKEAEYMNQNSQPTINESQFIQYLLDTSASLEQAVEKAKQVRVDKLFAPVHYFMCDVSGACAVLEFLKGEMVIHTEQNNQVSFISNSPYQQTLMTDFTSEDFHNVLKENENNLLDYSFLFLDKVKVNNWTRWQIVYDQFSKTIQFRTVAQQNMRSLRLSDLNWSCQAPAQYLDLDGDQTGDISRHLQNIDQAANFKLSAMFTLLPPNMMNFGAQYPQQALTCIE